MNRFVLTLGVMGAAWRWLMPRTHVYIGGRWFTVYVPIDDFAERWTTAARTRTFMPLEPGILANPAQITLAEGRRR